MADAGKAVASETAEINKILVMLFINSHQKSSSPPRHAVIHRHGLCAAQGFEGLQEGGQALLPGATAFEVGFQRGQRERRRAAGQGFGDGADLLGEGGGPGVLMRFDEL